MLVYIFLFFVLFGGFYLVDYKGNRTIATFFCTIEMFALVTFVTCQWRLGGDNLSYEYDYYDMPSIEQLNIYNLTIGAKFQPLWLLFCAFVKSFSSSYILFHFVHCTFLTVVSFWFLKKYTNYYLSVIFLYTISFSFFMFNIDLQRESLAVMVFLLMFKYLENKNYLIYYLVWPIAFLFHISSVFLLVLPPLLIVLNKVTNFKRIVIFVLLLAFCTVTVFNSVMDSFLMSSSSDVTSNVLNQASSYNEIESNFAHAFIMGLLGATPIVILVFVRIKFKLPIDIFTRLCIISIIIELSSGYIVGIYRFSNYLLFPYYICLVNTVSVLYKRPQAKFLIHLMFVLIFILTFYKLTTPAPFLGTGKMYYNMYVPYKSIFD